MNQNSQLLKLIDVLRAKNLKLGLAESCSGGLLSATITEVPGVSDFYTGGIVGYSNSIKQSILGVKEETLKKFGAVSAETAQEMAKGVCEKLNADCAIAITGIAGPSGGTPEKPVGTVFFAIKGPDFEMAKKEIFTGTRIEIQKLSVICSIEYLLNQLLR